MILLMRWEGYYVTLFQSRLVLKQVHNHLRLTTNWSTPLHAYMSRTKVTLNPMVLVAAILGSRYMVNSFNSSLSEQALDLNWGLS